MSLPIVVGLSSTKFYAHNYLTLVLNQPNWLTYRSVKHLTLYHISLCWNHAHCLVLDQGHFFHDLSWSLWHFCDLKLLCTTLSASSPRDTGNLKFALYYNPLCVYILYEFMSDLVLIIFMLLPAAPSTVYWMQFAFNIWLLDFTC